MRKIIVLAAAAALTLSACGKTDQIKKPSEGGGAASNAVNVKAHEYAFDVSGKPTTGSLSIEFANTGKELHHGIIGKLDEGKTLDDVNAFLKAGGQEPPEWFDDSPTDVNLLSPGEKATITFEAKSAGTYVLLCFMPTPTGEPHVAKGMINTFEVAEGGDTKAPKAAATIEMTEYTFSTPSVKAGDVSLEFKNAGKERHEFIVVQFAEGKKPADVDAWFEGGLKGDAPATFYGGTHEIAPGESAFFTANLKAGTYTLVCGVETEDGKNHADDLGMMTELKIA
ncbi:MAG TPA: hypothetical protein VM841_06235 [Actinomycetota bacterium]|nr:hypothetical protein [Actinomycetota bacterium]